MHLVRRHILLGKQVGREQREERNCANYHFHSCWSTQEPLLIKLKEIKFNCNQFPWAPQNYAHGRGGDCVKEERCFASVSTLWQLSYRISRESNISQTQPWCPFPKTTHLDPSVAACFPLKPVCVYMAMCSVLWQESATGHAVVPSKVPALKEPLSSRKGQHENQGTIPRHILCIFRWTLQSASFLVSLPISLDSTEIPTFARHSGSLWAGK